MNLDGYVFIRYLQMPVAVEGVTIPNDDNTFDVYINSLLCPRRQKAAERHEINHIKKNHLYDCEPVIVNELEAEAM